MSICISLHGLISVEHSPLMTVNNDVLRLLSKDGSEVNVYVPTVIAARFAQAWRDAKDAGEV
jgi:hypothetical protein